MEAEKLFADRYRLERRLGVGGMATVQLAMDTRLERRVAVKLLAEHLAADGNFVSRFRREALAAARLVHPNIVQVFDFGLDDATARNYIVMEFVDGESCAEILRDHGPLSPRDAVNVLTQACRGLDYALGVVSYQLLAGRLPYEAASLTDLARLQETGPPPRLDELVPDVSPALAEAIMVALHRDPERRYADAADMEQALSDGLQGRGPAAAPENT